MTVEPARIEREIYSLLFSYQVESSSGYFMELIQVGPIAESNRAWP